MIDKKMPVPRPVTPSNKLSFDSGLGSPNTPSRQGTYAATLTARTGSFSSESELGDITNISRTPKILLKSHRKHALSDVNEVITKVKSLPVCTVHPQRFVRWQQERTKKREDKGKPFRDEEIPSHLPGYLVDLIAGLTVTEREKNLLSTRQLQAALSWGKERDNFRTEQEWRRMAEGSQTWTLLESIGCLAYSRH
jgi:hypothetical protein